MGSFDIGIVAAMEKIAKMPSFVRGGGAPTSPWLKKRVAISEMGKELGPSGAHIGELLAGKKSRLLQQANPANLAQWQRQAWGRGSGAKNLLPR
jgi:hypothetical protein